ncbi:hypothetical protein [Candidatus Clostridium stratigraminis]|uniref:Uncharacterized protein n=1 Tax=Candidatus Clostridium stratigraminis TaxID=3381661 RepID=A0ABW8T716_9CLOT
MYYQLFYLKDENKVTIIDEYGTKQYDFGTEFAIVLFDNEKKPFSFIGLAYTEYNIGLGCDTTLTEVIKILQRYGFNKYASNKSAKKLREEVTRREDISYKNLDTGEQRDFYNRAKDTVYNRRVYDLAIIDNKTREELVVFKNYDFNNDNPSIRVIAEGIMDYTTKYIDTKEYEEDCREREEELRRELEEEERVREQERIGEEAEALVREEEAKRIEELIRAKVKELENQERI